MSIIIKSTLKALTKSQIILDNISNAQLCDTSVPPYHSSIGTHLRHILDFYTCIFNGIQDNVIDLTARPRNYLVENDCLCAQEYLNQIIELLHSTSLQINDSVLVTDDLGLGKIEILYTYGALFAQANSHTIHHYAIINYMLNSLGITINDDEFGYNPTTPKQVKS